MNNHEKLVEHFLKCIDFINREIAPNIIGTMKVVWDDGQSSTPYEFFVSKKRVDGVFWRETYYLEDVYGVKHFSDMSDNALMSFLREWHGWIKNMLVNKIKKDKELVDTFEV